MADQPRHIPYEEEAQLMTDVIEFFVHKLPHAISETMDHLDEAALSAGLAQSLQQMTDRELAGLGLHRDEISGVAAATAGLFKVAHKKANSGS